MGVIDGLSNAWSSATDAIDEAASAVGSAASGAADAAAGAVGDAYEAASDAVGSAAQQVGEVASAVADTAGDVASTVADTAGQVIDTAADAAQSAAAWGAHVADQAAGVLQSSLESVGLGSGPETSQGVEGGAPGGANSGDPNERVNLGSRDDVHRFLATFGQQDRLDSTQSDGSRCQSNVVVAGLLLQGGSEGLERGLTSARGVAQQRLQGETDPVRRQALEGAIRNFDTAIANARSGQATRGDLDRAADALFHTYASRSDYDAQGNLSTNGLDAQVINQMERDVGLTTQTQASEIGEQSGWNPANWFQSDNGEVADNVWENVQPGRSAHIAVNLYGEYAAQGHGPNNEPIREDSQGRSYFEPSDPNSGLATDNRFSPPRCYVERDTNHAVLFGRDQDGGRYIYNPFGHPPHIRESSDPAAFQRMTERLMGRQGSGDYHARATQFS